MQNLRIAPPSKEQSQRRQALEQIREHMKRLSDTSKRLHLLQAAI